MSSSSGYSIAFIRFWIIIGSVVFVGLVLSPYVIKRAVESEQERFEACKKGQRADCVSSFTWIKNGWQLRDYRSLEQATINTNLQTSSTASTEEKKQFDLGSTDETAHVITTSREKAPTIISVKPEGMDLVTHRYLAKSGTTVKVVAQIAKAQSVGLWVIKHEPSGTPFPTKIGDMKKTGDQTYEASFKVTEGLFGELEVRAQGLEKGENTSMFVNIAATTGE